MRLSLGWSLASVALIFAGCLGEVGDMEDGGSTGGGRSAAGGGVATGGGTTSTGGGTSATGGGTTATGGGTTATGGGTSATGGGTSATGGGTTATGGGTSATGGGTAATGGGTSATGGGTAATGGGTAATGGGTSATGGGTSAKGGGTAAGVPRVLFTDLASGPNTGGENNNGVYLSIFGMNFGTSGLGTTTKVLINDVEPAVYRALGPSRVRSDLQQITVQIGALGNPKAGTALPIKVVVNGVASNTDITFIVNPGRLLFVDNVTGKDSTAVPGDPTHPYRFVQTPALYTGGAWPEAKPGDVIVLRGKGTPWTDVGFEGYFMRFRDKSGSPPTGVSGTGPITIMGYPGEDVFIRGQISQGMTGGCISAINGQTYPTAGKWAAITNLRMDCEGYDGPISTEVYGDNWRVVNNDLAASTAPTSGANVPKMAGITGNGQHEFWVGNHIHDVQGSFGECHGIYIDGDGSYEIAFNHIHDIRSGNGFQVYVNGGNGSDVCSNVSLHHNLIHDVSKHGINIADGSKDNFVVFNNVVYNTAYAGLRFNTLDMKGGKFFNNTFYNVLTASNSNYGAIMNDWNLVAGSIDVENNIFWPHAGSEYNGGSNGVPASAGTIRNNLWYGGTGTVELDSLPRSGNPNFVNAAAHDFHLTAGPAVDSGSASVSSVVTNDYDVLTTRPQHSVIDVGAFELK